MIDTSWCNMNTAPLTDSFTINTLDIFFISYDEPNAETNWKHLQEITNNQAKRIHNVKGFDKVHKLCAKSSTTRRLVIVDGDSWVNSNILAVTLDDAEHKTACFSFKSINFINGLEYGNGGIKIWDKNTLLDSNTHETSNTTDFCWDIPYYQIDQISGTTVQNASPYQAWRAGYREGVKLTYLNGKPINNWNSDRKKLWKGNLSKLSVWCSVGRDIENGIWAILGARQGLCETLGSELDTTAINDYDWFNAKWQTVQDSDPESSATQYAATLDTHYDFYIPELDVKSSKWFKHTYINPARQGLMK